MAARQAGPRRKRPRRGALAPLSTRLLTEFTRVIEALTALQVRFAVIGGLAVSARAEPRTTKDIDFAVSVSSDAAAEALIHALLARGYRVESLFERTDGRLATVRTTGAAQILIDYLFASSRIEAEVVAQATQVDVAGVLAPVAQSGHLLAMKVRANRLKDAADIEHLIERASARELRRCVAALRLMQARGAAQGRDLLAELKAHVARVRRGDPEMRPSSGARLRRLRRGGRPPPRGAR